MRVVRFVLVALSLTLIVPACSRKAHKPVHAVRGQVLVQGRPASQAIVTFHPVGAIEGDPRPSGQTDEQGFFQLSSYANGDGASEGDYDVTVTWFRSQNRTPTEGDESTRNVLPPRYANPATSLLRATVAPGDNELPPLQVQTR